MGNSATATIAFGFILPKSFDDDIEESYAEKKGILPPSKPYSRQENGDPDQEWSAYWSKKRNIYAASGVDIDIGGCSADDGDNDKILIVRASKINAYWEKAESFDPNSLKVQDGWVKMLVEFCETMGIEYQEPKWLLFAYYG